MFRYIQKLDAKTKYSLLRYYLPPTRYQRMRKSIFSLSLTRACNAKCLMCPRNCQKNYTSEHMDRETFLKSIDIFKRLSKDNMIVHSMGECLLHPEFDDFMRLLKRNGIRIRISTNGINVIKHMDTLVNVDYFKYSIEGWDAETVRKFRGVSFEKLYSNVKEFWQYSRGKINYPIRLATHLYKSITKENLQQMVETWGPYVDEIGLGIANNPELNHSKPYDPEAQLDSNLPERYRSNFFHMLPDETPYCGYAIRGAFMQPNGDVVPCCNDYSNLLVMGNIHESPLEDIFWGERYKQLRRQFYKGKATVCGNCSMLYKFDAATIKKHAKYMDYVTKLHQKIKRQR